MSKITRVRFSKEDDIELLRLVVGENPYENPGIWKLIHSKLNRHTGKEFTLRGVKEHVEYLSKLFVKEDLANLRKSGTEEQYEELEKLLQELVDMRCELKYQTDSVTQNSGQGTVYDKAEVKQKGIALRDKATVEYVFEDENTDSIDDNSKVVEFYVNNNLHEGEGSNESEEITVTTDETVTRDQPPKTTPISRKRRSKTDLSNEGMQFLQKRIDMESEIKKSQIAFEERKLLLEERRLMLEEARFEVEKKEREKRMELEAQEKKMLIDALEQQQKLIYFVMNKLQ